jgi:hypothetical protein
MFIYSPSILDGVATFRGLFKIDVTWGDAAYGVGGNVGGGINAGQVNMQTLLANVDIRPKDSDWNIVIGMQRLFDNVRDPNITAVSTHQTSGYKLSYFGTQAVGINVFGNLTKTTMFRAGYFQLYENIIEKDDDVSLWMFDIESRILPRLEVGADAWFVWDRGKSAGGISVLGQGLNSGLAEYNGAPRLYLPTSKYEANLGWFGAHASYNRDFATGRLWGDAFVMSNFGTIDTVSTSTKHYADIIGVAANASLNYKYDMTVNDRISLEVVFSSGDGNGGSDGTVNSVFTGNVYGSPTAIYSNHRALLLFPDPKVVNRYYSAVHDISNMGYGVTGLMASVSRDFIPNKLYAKAGLSTAFSNVVPKKGSSHIGTEYNIEVQYTYRVFLTFSINAGYMEIGNFFNSPDVTYDHKRPTEDPWVVFATMSWLMF